MAFSLKGGLDHADEDAVDDVIKRADHHRENHGDGHFQKQKRDFLRAHRIAGLFSFFHKKYLVET